MDDKDDVCVVRFYLTDDARHIAVADVKDNVIVYEYREGEYVKAARHNFGTGGRKRSAVACCGDTMFVLRDDALLRWDVLRDSETTPRKVCSVERPQHCYYYPCVVGGSDWLALSVPGEGVRIYKEAAEMTRLIPIKRVGDVLGRDVEPVSLRVSVGGRYLTVRTSEVASDGADLYDVYWCDSQHAFELVGECSFGYEGWNELVIDEERRRVAIFPRNDLSARVCSLDAFDVDAHAATLYAGLPTNDDATDDKTRRFLYGAEFASDDGTLLVADSNGVAATPHKAAAARVVYRASFGDTLMVSASLKPLTLPDGTRALLVYTGFCGAIELAVDCRHARAAAQYYAARRQRARQLALQQGLHGAV